jgi:hypothetical protein
MRISSETKRDIIDGLMFPFSMLSVTIDMFRFLIPKSGVLQV